MAVPPGLLPALDALFGAGGTRADARRAAEAWLLSFQQGDAAWQVWGAGGWFICMACMSARIRAGRGSGAGCTRFASIGRARAFSLATILTHTVHPSTPHPRPPSPS
jgi:hypothetical protein